MPTVWRLIKSRYAHLAFDGEGARLYGGRWNSNGVAVAYASDSPALAVLEVLVHLQSSRILGAYALVSAEVPDELIEVAANLPPNWKHSPAPPEVQALGDSWVHASSSAVLQVPSAVVDLAFNYLLNPVHRDFARIRIGSPRPFEFDPRLLRSEW